MKDLILKWWNRKWSNWELQEVQFWAFKKYIILRSISDDGLVRYKRIKVY